MASTSDSYVSPGAIGILNTGSTSDNNDAPTNTPAPSDPNYPCFSQTNLQAVTGPNISCTVSALPFPEFESIIEDQDAGTGYALEVLEPAWDTNYHTLQMPVASTQTPVCSFAVVANPTMRKRLKWTVNKWGSWPEMPIAETGDPNEVLLDVKITGQSVDLMGDQTTPTYNISGEYIYGYVDWTQVTKYLGVAPYINLTVAETAIPDSSFVAEIATPT